MKDLSAFVRLSFLVLLSTCTCASYRDTSKYGSNILNLGNFVTVFLQAQVFYKVYV